ncbi:MAG: hypothetical protein AAGB51_02240 [Planctomycetota bacterium]
MSHRWVCVGVLPFVLAMVLPWLNSGALAQDERPRTIELESRAALQAFEVLRNAPEPDPYAAPRPFLAARASVWFGDRRIAATESAGPAPIGVIGRELARRLDLAVPEMAMSAPELVIDLELVVEVIPVEFEDLFAPAVAPGIDGLAVAIGQGPFRFIFPSELMRRGLGPRDALRSMLSDDLEPSDPAMVQPELLEERHGARIYRTRVVRLANRPGETSPRFVFRAGNLVPSASVTMASIEAEARSIAKHMLSRIGSPGIAGVPAVAFVDPLGLGDEERWRPDGATQCLAAYLLLRYAPRFDNERDRAEARAIASQVLTGWRQRLGTTPPYAAAAVAAFTLAADAYEGAPAIDAGDRVRLRAALTHEVLPRTPAGLRAVAAFGLANLGAHGEESDSRRARQALDAIYDELGADGLASAMPFIVHAEVLLAAEGEPIRAANILGDLRDLAENAQRTETTSPREPDLVGGISLSQRGGRTLPPTWQSLRLAAAQAVMLSDPRFTPSHDVPFRMSSLLASARFCAQLSHEASDPGSGPAQTPVAGVRSGGLRAAAWSPELPLAASATGLLFLLETLDAIEARSPQKPDSDG